MLARVLPCMKSSLSSPNGHSESARLVLVSICSLCGTAICQNHSSPFFTLLICYSSWRLSLYAGQCRLDEASNRADLSVLAQTTLSAQLYSMRNLEADCWKKSIPASCRALSRFSCPRSKIFFLKILYSHGNLSAQDSVSCNRCGRSEWYGRL